MFQVQPLLLDFVVFAKHLKIKYMKLKLKDKTTIKGEVVFTYRKVPKYLIPLERLGFYNLIIKLCPVVSKHEYTNLVCTAGKDTIVSRWCGDTSKSGILTYLALGTGTNVPNASDTKLQTEVYRKLITHRTKSGTTCQTSTFIPTNEGNYTYKEVGLYGDDASLTPDSGTLYTHAAVNETKVNGVSLTVDYNLQIT